MRTTTGAVAALLVGLLATTASAGAIGDVSEIGGYTQIYQFNAPNFAGGSVTYGVDNSGLALGAFSRVGYYMELQQPGGARQWVWASMDAFTTDLTKIGLPTVAAGAVWQQAVANMNVESNVGSIVTGTGITTGNIEFWPSCYGPGGALGLGGNNSLYDFDDVRSGFSSCYGSMQVHNYGAGQTLMAYNQWAGAGELGIGNQVGGSGHPDWTFANNVASYSLRSIEVWATAPIPEPSTWALFGLGGLFLAFRRKRRSPAA